MEEAGNPEKREKFVRLAEKRTINALRTIRLIGNLSNRGHYDYDDTDVRKIVAALTREITEMQRKFGDKTSKTSSEFKL
jgi:hypothetical protein